MSVCLAGKYAGRSEHFDSYILPEEDQYLADEVVFILTMTFSNTADSYIWWKPKDKCIDDLLLLAII